jgi:hypothetical protein
MLSMQGRKDFLYAPFVLEARRDGLEEEHAEIIRQPPYPDSGSATPYT